MVVQPLVKLVILAQANRVQFEIRVGPGANRTVIAFLPAGINFEALGQTSDSDGNMWFSVPKEEVAPTKAVNETWVAADSVDQSGDCANVVDALAPPIIPIRQAQPTLVPQVAEDGTVTEPVVDTTANTGDAFAVDADGAFIPTQGTWLESHNNGTFSCENGRSGTTSPRTGNSTATLSGGGVDGINFNGYFYAYIGNNTYEAYETVLVSAGGDYLARLTFTLTSANTGEGSIGEVYRRCNYYLPFTINFVG